MPFSETFDVGVFHIRYYSLTMLLAVSVGYFIGRKFAKKAGIEVGIFDDLAFWLVIFGFLGARVYEVIAQWPYYSTYPSEIIKIWHGGLSIYGSILAGAIVLYVFSKKRNLKFAKLLDIVSLALPISQAIGRFGNYFNHEAFGKPTSLPWKIFIPTAERPQGYEAHSYFHPTFLYEVIWNVLVFLFLLWFKENKKKTAKSDGLLTCWYILLYSIGRFLIEGLRLDSAYIGAFKTNQVVALLLIFASLGIMIFRYAPQTDK